MQSQPVEQHQWLSQFVGQWSCEGESVATDGQPAHKMQATEIVRSIGGLWVVCEAHSKMPDGSPATTVMTLGYDPQRQRFVGTFLGSMMTHLWIYEGQLDAGRNILTLDTVGPTFTGDGKMAQYKDVIEFKAPDHRILTSHTLTADNQWQHFMTAHYRRQA